MIPDQKKQIQPLRNIFLRQNFGYGFVKNASVYILISAFLSVIILNGCKSILPVGPEGNAGSVSLAKSNIGKIAFEGLLNVILIVNLAGEFYQVKKLVLLK